MKSGRRNSLGWSLELRPEGIVSEDHRADIGDALAQIVMLEALVGGPDVHPQPVGTFVGC